MKDSPTTRADKNDVGQTSEFTVTCPLLNLGDDALDVAEVAERVDMGTWRVTGHGPQLVKIIATHPDGEDGHACLLKTHPTMTLS